MNSFHLPSLPTTTHPVLLLELHLPTRVIIQTSQFIPNVIYFLLAHMTLSPTSTNYIKSSENTSWMLNVDINSQLTPDIFQPQNSRLAVKPSSKLSFSVQHNPPRSFLRNSLNCMRSLHDPARTPSLYDFRTVFALYTRYSTSQC